MILNKYYEVNHAIYIFIVNRFEENIYIIFINLVKLKINCLLKKTDTQVFFSLGRGEYDLSMKLVKKEQQPRGILQNLPKQLNFVVELNRVL